MLTSPFFVLAAFVIFVNYSKGFTNAKLITSSIQSSSKSLPGSLKSTLSKLVEKKDLTKIETEEAWDEILSGADPAVVGALLSLLRAKGETAIEIAGMVKSMKKACHAVNMDRQSISKLLDIVGTGGDGADTINISTASVILAAACGCKVAKAGNRSVSSRCGSADVLESLGVTIELSPENVAKSIQQCGIGFMYAPINHPAMKTVAPIRKSLGIRTVFNILGPMTNAADAERVVIGVFDESLLDLIAQSLIEIGTIDHGVVVNGCGLDEISPLGKSTIVEIRNTAKPGVLPKKYTTKRYFFDPLSVGIPRCSITDLKGGDAVENAQALIDVLAPGEYSNAKRDSVLLNAGVGIYVYGLTQSIGEGVTLARKILYEGKAADKLKEWIQVTQQLFKNNHKS